MKIENTTKTFEECESTIGLRPTGNSGRGQSPNTHRVCDDANPVVFAAPEKPKLLGLFELILKDRPRLHRILRDPSLHSDLIPRFLAISLVGFLFYGVAMSVVLHTAGRWPALMNSKEWLDSSHGSLLAFSDDIDKAPLARWWNGSAFKLITAYGVGLVAATGVCLPSLYFYSLLSGIRMSMVEVTVHALKAKATTAVALVGILPIYAAIAMGMVVFDAPPRLLEQSLLLGLALPFVAGLWGTTSLYIGFAGLCDRMPEARRDQRSSFLRRLVLSWSACYSAVMPVMIYTLWQSFGT